MSIQFLIALVHIFLLSILLTSCKYPFNFYLVDLNVFNVLVSFLLGLFVHRMGGKYIQFLYSFFIRGLSNEWLNHIEHKFLDSNSK